MHFTVQRWGVGLSTREPWDGARLALPQEGNDAFQGKRWGLGFGSQHERSGNKEFPAKQKQPNAMNKGYEGRICPWYLMNTKGEAPSCPGVLQACLVARSGRAK